MSYKHLRFVAMNILWQIKVKNLNPATIDIVTMSFDAKSEYSVVKFIIVFGVIFVVIKRRDWDLRDH